RGAAAGPGAGPPQAGRRWPHDYRPLRLRGSRQPFVQRVGRRPGSARTISAIELGTLLLDATRRHSGRRFARPRTRPGRAGRGPGGHRPRAGGPIAGPLGMGRGTEGATMTTAIPPNGTDRAADYQRQRLADGHACLAAALDYLAR